MRVLLLRSNPRKIGYTQRLADLFLRGLREAGAEVEDVDLCALSVNNCLGCFHCWLETPGQCVHNDDMTALLEKVLSADALVCATPIYYYSMSSHLKTFFERTFPLAQPGLVGSGRGMTRNSIRYPERWKGKKLVTIVTGALPDREVYRPANETFQLIADSLDLELAGQLTRPECYLLDYPLSKPKTLVAIESAFVQAGRELGAAGRIAKETLEAASLPLSSDPERFRVYSNIYWTRASQMGPQALDPSEVQKHVASDVRILLREMVRCHDSKATSRIKAVLQFEFPDQALICQVRIDAGHCELTEATELSVAAPDLSIRCITADWAAVFTRQIDLREAIKSSRITLKGDKSLFARLDRFFPPPSA